MKSDQKGFGVAAALTVVFAICIVGAVGWFIYDKQLGKDQTNTETVNQQLEQKEEDFQYKDVAIPTDWKTYENEEHGFSFQYPANYSLLETGFDSGESEDNAVFVASANTPAGQGVGGYEVRVLKSSLDAAVKNDGLNVNDNQSKSTITEKDVYVSGHKAVELSYVPDGLKTSWFFVEKDNDTVIRFAVVEDSGANAEESKAIYNSLTIK